MESNIKQHSTTKINYGPQAPDIPAPQPPPAQLEPTQQATHPVQPTQQVQQVQQLTQINWSHFKPQFSGKPEEDVEAHLLQTNDWRNAYHFLEDIKVRKFCLTLVGGVRLWSFHFDENTETIDEYVTCIRQVGTLLDYGEPQILEVFKNTLPHKIV